MTAKLVDYLPEFISFLRQLTRDVKSKKITSWTAFKTTVNPFYSDDMMQKIDSIAPGWIEMASYADRLTLIHVTAVFVALMLSQEYQSATEAQRNLMEWAVLFHDITKVPVKGGHDYVHAYKSAAVAGKALTKLGFPTNATQKEIDTWYDLTYTATFYSEEHGAMIQDIEKLPQIIEGLKSIHSEDAYVIVLTILLHLAIVLDVHYPIPAPMGEDQMKMSITTDSFPVMKGMFLADGNAWHLFDEDNLADKQRRDYASNVFDRIATLVNLPGSSS